MQTIHHSQLDAQLAQFGRNLRRARETAGLSQDEVGINRGTMSILERALRSPDLPTVVRLAHAVHVTPAQLLLGLGDTASHVRGPQYQPDPSVSPASYFGANLRWARKIAGMSQATLAAAAGVDHAAISAFEHGLRDPNLRSIIRLACSLRVPASMLLNDLPSSDKPLKSSPRQLALRGTTRPPTPTTKRPGRQAGTT
jgi:transcriptional regulator with XRE-family HTH domain